MRAELSELLDFYKVNHFHTEMDALNDVALRFMEADLRHPGKKDYLTSCRSWSLPMRAIFIRSSKPIMV